jgi:hypothetical protein
MDSLLAGTLILPWRVHCAGYDVQRRRACRNIPGIVKTIPGSGEKLFAFPPESLFAFPPGILFVFTPERFSRSPRNHCSPSPGIRKPLCD